MRAPAVASRSQRHPLCRSKARYDGSFRRGSGLFGSLAKPLEFNTLLFNHEGMNRGHATISALAMLFLALPSNVATARGGGMGVHAFHAGGHFRPFFRNKHGRFAHNNQNLWWPWYGGYGYYAIPSDGYGGGDVTGAAPATVPTTVMYVPAPAPACRKVQEAMTVPSEEGGTRQVTVTRCQGS